ncbi:hypothetical protein BDP27DRAFT_1412767 [Rhodocollybia butyracea]|uniref:Uncharacterized protein n=1 Tax=Rhodocollybia butyracea TaxID=206335 RepID=A0A9P5UGR9_9AGAR|nr:hypothetical protein BDP27DRAFT_1412767 [Rhodocollybia butyracea]
MSTSTMNTTSETTLAPPTPNYGGSNSPKHSTAPSEWTQDSYFESQQGHFEKKVPWRDPSDDYEQRFPEDPMFEEAAPNARVWRTYLEEK